MLEAANLAQRIPVEQEAAWVVVEVRVKVAVLELGKAPQEPSGVDCVEPVHHRQLVDYCVFYVVDELTFVVNRRMGYSSVRVHQVGKVLNGYEMVSVVSISEDLLLNWVTK